LPSPRVTVAVPTLASDSVLWECVVSLQRQTYTNHHIVIVDNSGSHRVDTRWPPEIPRDRVSILHPGTNTGFGAAFNLAAREYPADFVAIINDDASAAPGWLSQLVAAASEHPSAGSFASQVLLSDQPGLLDSAGMRIAIDGTTKQRGHREPAANYAAPGETLFASGSACLYRAEMLKDTGGFDASFFLYCEDADLGLRAQWAGWTCRYVPAAVVVHRYSHSAGRASRLKAYYVERNRIFFILKNFPLLYLLRAPFATIARYWFHLVSMRQGKGAAGEFKRGGGGAVWLASCALRAHVSAVLHLPSLLRKRWAIRAAAKIEGSRFAHFFEQHRISLREVAEL
jgi:GT2 family glycosyltransferase